MIKSVQPNLSILKNEKSKLNKNIIQYNDYELNNLDYKEAIFIDKRNYIEYYFSLLRKKQILIFTFYTYNDYNSKSIKLCLFLFTFALYYVVNALFFNDSTMHKIYQDKGMYDINYQIVHIIYSVIISDVINIIINFLSLSEKIIISLKNKTNDIKEKKSKIIKCLKIKFILFFIFIFLFLLLFWYYISCFCAIYKNIQIHLIKDTLISFGLSTLYPVFLSLIPGIFRIPALKAKKQDKECIYKFSKLIQLI